MVYLTYLFYLFTLRNTRKNYTSVVVNKIINLLLTYRNQGCIFQAHEFHVFKVQKNQLRSFVYHCRKGHYKSIKRGPCSHLRYLYVISIQIWWWIPRAEVLSDVGLLKHVIYHNFTTHNELLLRSGAICYHY